MGRIGTREQLGLMLLILTFVSLWALGGVGWWIATPGIAFLEAVYRGLQLFSLNFDTPDDPNINGVLQLARFACPAFTIGAFAATVSAQLRLYARTILSRGREQVTIIGYGIAGKASAERFRASRPDARIVALDNSITDADRRAARNHGVELIECDMLDADARRSFPIGLSRSSEIVIACGSDQTNLSLLDELKTELRADGERPVRLWLQVSSHALAERLRESYGQSDAAAPVVEFVEVADHAAQAVLIEHPLVLEARAAGLKRVHAVIHGFDDFGWLCTEHVLLNGFFPAPTFAPPLVTIIAEDGGAAEAAWRARHPDLQAQAEVWFHTGADPYIAWSNPDDATLRAVEDAAMPSIHIFAGEDSERSLSSALALRDAMRRGARPVAPVVVRSDHRRLTGRDLSSASGVMQLRLTIIDGYHTSASVFGVAGQVLEQRARRFHAAYAGDGPGTSFDRIPHTQRLSNRRAAFHLIDKLRLLGFEGAGPDGTTYGLGAEGIKWLGGLDAKALRDIDVLEHQRWRVDRLIEGWRDGPRDSEKRLRDRLGDDWTHFDSLAVVEKQKVRSQLDDFLEAASRATVPATPVPLIAPRVWEGTPPVWSFTDDGLALRFPEGAKPTDFDAGPGAETRLRILVPQDPPWPEGDADRRADAVRRALRTFGQDILREAPSGTRVRFERPGNAPWNWLPPDPEGRVDGVTLPDFRVGFTGHRDFSRLGDLDLLRSILRRDVAALCPPGTPLVTGLAVGADRLMIEIWRELGLGPITGVAPYAHAGWPAVGIAPDDVVPEDICAACESVQIVADVDGVDAAVGPAHGRVADMILDHATLLMAVSDGRNGGLAGTEDIVAQARHRQLLVRYVPIL